jgi:hypothetical protein
MNVFANVNLNAHKITILADEPYPILRKAQGSHRWKEKGPSEFSDGPLFQLYGQS